MSEPIFFLCAGNGSSPNQLKDPLSACTIPVMIASVVVLPLPLGPRIPKILPSWISRETPFTAFMEPYDLVRSVVRKTVFKGLLKLEGELFLLKGGLNAPFQLKTGFSLT